MAKDKKEPTLFPETTEIISLLSKDSPQDMVVVAVPSHDKKNLPLPKAQMAEWASNAMQLLADLYGGATAFETYAGIFKTDEGHYLRDKPILIESFATIAAIQDPERLELLVNFAKRMGKTLDQDTIMLVFGTVSYYIKDYSGV
jgi:hypothetical protein